MKLKFKAELLRVHAVITELRIPEREILSISFYGYVIPNLHVRFDSFVRVFQSGGRVTKFESNVDKEGDIVASFQSRGIHWTVCLLGDHPEHREIVMRMIQSVSPRLQGPKSNLRITTEPKRIGVANG